MKHSDFNKMIRKVFSDCQELLAGKNKGYANADDALSNFKAMARNQGRPMTQEQALLGCEVKHRTSVLDIINDTQNLSRVEFLAKWTPSKIEGKIYDEICYMAILRTQLAERMEQPIVSNVSGGINAQS